MHKDSHEKPPSSTLDRLNESHWHIHQMENHFHFANHFRWALNGFLRSIKEVPQLVSMEFQIHPEFPNWYRPRRKLLYNNPLLEHLSKSRDIIVHQKMLIPSSTGCFGITRGRGVKLGIGIPIDPKLDSDEAMRKCASVAREKGDFMGFFDPHDEDTTPCIERTWRLPKFPDDDILDLCVKAWKLVSEDVADTFEYINGIRPQTDPGCQHGSEFVKLRAYNRMELAKYVYAPGSKAKTGPLSPKAIIDNARNTKRPPSP